MLPFSCSASSKWINVFQLEMKPLGPIPFNQIKVDDNQIVNRTNGLWFRLLNVYQPLRSGDGFPAALKTFTPGFCAVIWIYLSFNFPFSKWIFVAGTECNTARDNQKPDRYDVTSESSWLDHRQIISSMKCRQSTQQQTAHVRNSKSDW